MESDGFGRGNQVNIFPVMIAECGLRNGGSGARAVNVNNAVTQDLVRVREQVYSNTLKPAKPMHLKAGESQEVPLPRWVREATERYAAEHGATKGGNLLRGPGGYFTQGTKRRRVRKLLADFPPAELDPSRPPTMAPPPPASSAPA
ncbi:hypothetical protein [Streptomyces zaomyceticus]|uniref:hypothetical protein n=1 Tax=Streptomyces zaomyceticus TaxID=68286 RepID=UPI0033B3F23D